VSDDKKDALTNAFGLVPLDPNEIVVMDAPNEDTEKHDFETARQNMHHLLQKGEHALDEMISLAIQNQQARSFEVVSNLIKTLADVNKDLISLQEKKKQLSLKTDEKTSPSKVVNNQNLFVGSTDELLDLISNMKNK
jgi:hypothetical protein